MTSRYLRGHDLSSLSLDPPPEDKVAADPEHDEESAEHDEVDVEPRVLHLHSPQHVVAVLEHTLASLRLLTALQHPALVAVDRL